MTGLWLASYVVLWILFLIVAVVLLSVLHHLGLIYSKLDRKLPPPTALASGAPLPEITLSAPDGQQVQLSQFQGRKVAFVIISPGCSGCLSVLKAMATGDIELSVEQVVVLSMRDLAATLEIVGKAGLPADYPVLVSTDNAIERQWGVSVTPIIVEVDSELKVSRQTFFPSPELIAAN